MQARFTPSMHAMQLPEMKTSDLTLAVMAQCTVIFDAGCHGPMHAMRRQALQPVAAGLGVLHDWNATAP